MKFRTARYLVKEGARGLKQHRAMSATSVVTMAAGLLVLGAFLIVSYNVLVLLTDLQSRKEVAVYLKDGITAEDRQLLESRFTMNPAVESAVFVPRDEAWEAFSAEMNVDGLLEAVGDNPLPDSYRLTFKPESRDAGTITNVGAEVGLWDEVDDVVTGGEWLTRLDQFAGIVMTITLAIGLAVALSIIAIIANTVRLTIVARRDLIEIMKLVGASESFIRVPFLSEGVLQSMLAALLALGALYGVTLFLGTKMEGVLFLSPLWCLGFVGFAFLMGLLGSSFSVRHVLSRVGI